MKRGCGSWPRAQGSAASCTWLAVAPCDTHSPWSATPNPTPPSCLASFHFPDAYLDLAQVLLSWEHPSDTDYIMSHVGLFSSVPPLERQRQPPCDSWLHPCDFARLLHGCKHLLLLFLLAQHLLLNNIVLNELVTRKQLLRRTVPRTIYLDFSNSVCKNYSQGGKVVAYWGSTTRFIARSDGEQEINI